MARKNQESSDPHIRTLKNAEKFAQQQVDDDCADELYRVGILWSGILNLDHAIPPTEVAAMLAAYELIRASRLVDAEPHWTNVAAFAVVGSFLESVNQHSSFEDSGSDDEESRPVGFTAQI